MRGRFVLEAIGLTGVTLLALACSPVCGSSSASSTNASCGSGGSAHRAYVVVEHGSGASITRCVGFTAASIDGAAAMRLSGLQYQSRASAAAQAMCQIDNEPATFDRCFPLNQPYWALFVESHRSWGPAPQGYAEVRLGDGDALGWHYVAAGDPSPAPPPLPPAS